MAYVSKIEDFEEFSSNFIIIYNESFSYQGSWYGPPDPPAGTETKNFIQTECFSTKEEVVEWIKKNAETKYGRPKAFKVFMIDEMKIKTEISISVG